MKIEILTLFPGYFESVFAHSIMGRAQDSGALEVTIHDIRDFTTDRHHQADDIIYGGGSGMLLLAEPIFRGVEQIITDAKRRPMIIYPTAQGKQFRQADAAELALRGHLVFICGHYKGVDQRAVERCVDREYSLGDFVMTGGEPAAAAMIDAIVRLLPGVLGDPDSAKDDSFQADCLGSHLYTKPETLDGMTVPGVLLDGHHKNIGHWREINSRVLTLNRRPDLIQQKDGERNGKLEKYNKKSTEV